MTYRLCVMSNKIYNCCIFSNFVNSEPIDSKSVHTLIWPVLYIVKKCTNTNNITRITMGTKYPIIKHRAFFLIAAYHPFILDGMKLVWNFFKINTSCLQTTCICSSWNYHRSILYYTEFVCYYQYKELDKHLNNLQFCLMNIYTFLIWKCSFIGFWWGLARLILFQYMFILMLNDTEWKGLLCSYDWKPYKIWQYWELFWSDDHHVSKSGIKITPGCNTYIIIQSYNLIAITGM